MATPADAGVNNVVETRKRNSVGDLECVGTALEVECILPETPSDGAVNVSEANAELDETEASFTSQVADTLLLISPFFFWGTSMAVMKVVAPHTSPLFVGAVRLLPAGVVLVLWAAMSGRPQPKSVMAWTAVALFGLIDGACFQGCLAEGLQRTSAGLGSVIIDSQPITVALLANFFFDEALSSTIVAGMGLGILGLGLLEIPPQLLAGGPQALTEFISTSGGGLQMGSIWDSGEWWMLLAAQSMAVGTVMVRWVAKYCDPVSATGWHMVLGSLPLIALCVTRESDILIPRLAEFNGMDALSLLYITLLGSAASYGVFFYNASKGNLTSLSSLTFLTPVFATITGYVVLGESLTSLQLGGAAITLLGVFCINK
ncbi:hypothetical protein BSKO_04689 [Bryopsis sp. KO-2023]|nr:hypothetical protein BSKO_04689 [Bryopsis sp. KO-2023]